MMELVFLEPLRSIPLPFRARKRRLRQNNSTNQAFDETLAGGLARSSLESCAVETVT
jgi:hypothetical protein